MASHYIIYITAWCINATFEKQKNTYCIEMRYTLAPKTDMSYEHNSLAKPVLLSFVNMLCSVGGSVASRLKPSFEKYLWNNMGATSHNMNEEGP